MAAIQAPCGVAVGAPRLDRGRRPAHRPRGCRVSFQARLEPPARARINGGANRSGNRPRLGWRVVRQLRIHRVVGRRRTSRGGVILPRTRRAAGSADPRWLQRFSSCFSTAPCCSPMEPCAGLARPVSLRPQRRGIFVPRNDRTLDHSRSAGDMAAHLLRLGYVDGCGAGHGGHAARADTGARADHRTADARPEHRPRTVRGNQPGCDPHRIGLLPWHRPDGGPNRQPRGPHRCFAGARGDRASS